MFSRAPFIRWIRWIRGTINLLRSKCAGCLQNKTFSPLSFLALSFNRMHVGRNNRRNEAEDQSPDEHSETLREITTAARD